MTQLTTTQISEHFGLTMRSEFIVDTLGVPNTGKEKRAFLWEAALLPVIGQALIDHVESRRRDAPTRPEEVDSLFA